MKKYALILLLLLSSTFAFIAFGKDLIVTLSNNDVISIPLEPGSTLEVASSASLGVNEGDVLVSVSDTGMDLCDRINAVDATVTCTGGTGSAPTIVSFTASPNSVTSGGSTTLSWTLANNATSCTKSVVSGSTGSPAWTGTITGSQVVNGTYTQTISNITTNSTYRLQCSNSIGSSLLMTASVNIATSASCVSQPPPPSPIIEDTTILANFGGPGLPYDGTYIGMFPGTSATGWPGVSGQKIKLAIHKNEYVAAEFNSGNGDFTGTLQSIPITSFEGPSAFGQTWAISECPGDFNTHLNQAACKSGTDLSWSTEGFSPSTHCQLAKNTTYYLNLIHSATTDSTYSSTCFAPNVYCGFLGVNVY